MSYDYRNVDVDDFSGGETDIYLKAMPNRAEVLENFYILDTKKPRTRPGTRIDDADNTPQIPLGSQRIGGLVEFEGHLLVQSLNKIYFRNPATYSSLLGPAGGNPFLSTSALTAYSQAKWNHHMYVTSNVMEKPIKIFPDATGALKLRTAGLPDLPTAPTITPTAGTKNYVYVFAYECTYTVLDQQFVDVGPTTQLAVPNAQDPSVSAINITSIPALANGSGDNYDTASIKIGIYRSTDGGQVFYKVTTVNNGTTSYADTTGDDALQDTGITIYTDGGIPENDPPPMAKYCHTVNNITYYAHFKEGSQVFTNSYRQSQADDPDSVPKGFEDVLEDEITGFSSINEIPIIGCKSHIYRIEGAFDEAGRGGPVKKKIHPKAGCVSHESFVQTDYGLFWAGNDGFYWTDGNTVKKISKHLNKRYKERLDTFRDRTYRIKGVHDKLRELVYFTFSKTTRAELSEECDIIWVLDLRSGLSEEMPFYTWSGSELFFPSAIAIYDEELYRGDVQGYVLKFSEDYLTDTKINPLTSPTVWNEETIMWTYRSTAQNFGTSGNKKIANKIMLSCKNETNISLAIKAINDDGKISRDIEPIRWRRNFTWGDDEFVWGSPDFVWYYGGLIESDRRFPSKNMRFNYLQIELSNSYTNIVNSDLLGLASVNASLKTTTLVQSADADWPMQAVDYFIYFEFDNYTKGFKVLSRTADTMVLDDASNLLQDGPWKWQIKGYKKGEILSLNEYSISWAPTARSFDMFNKADRGSIED